MRIMLLLLGLLSFTLAKSQNFTHLSLKVAFDTTAEKVLGEVHHRLSQVQANDTVFLNGIRMEYKDVLWNGEKVNHTSNDTGLFIMPRTALDTNQVFIRYSAQPRKGIYFIGFDDPTHRSKKQIWTQGQGIDHRHWIPHNDDQTDKVVVDISATFNDEYSVISNGKLLLVQSEKGQKTWRYGMHEPMSSYLIALMIGRYDSLQSSSSEGIPLTQYFYPERRADYPVYYKGNEAIFNFLQDEIQVPYPWQNYKQAPVQDFRHGAMENTTATLFGDFFLVDSLAFNDRNYTYVNAHEAAHQWFGNWITAKNSKHHWLHEGFATYYQWLSEENLYGRAHFDWERKKARDMVFAASAVDSLPLAHGKAGSARFYQKGAWVLHMLVQKIGRSTYRQAIKDYLNRHARGIVTTDSLQMVLEKHCRCPLDTFFQQWVYSGVEPSLVLKETGSNQLTIALKMDSAFAMDLQFQILTKNNQVISKSFSTNRKETNYTFNLGLKPEEVVFWTLQNGHHLLAHITSRKSLPHWRQQYNRDTNLLNRYRAIEAMAEFAPSQRASFLREILQDEKAFFALRAKALDLLLANEDESETRSEHILTALNSPDVQLQKEAIMYVEKPEDELRDRVAFLRENGRSYELREAALQRSVNFDDPRSNRWLYDDIYKNKPGIPGHKVHLTALVYQLLIFKDREAFQKIADYSSVSYDFLTRMNAIDYLAALKIADEAVINNLFNGLFDPNWKLRSSARKALLALYETPNQVLIEEYRSKNADNWQPFQKRIVERTFDQ